MLVYKLGGTLNAELCFIPRLMQLASATSATVAALCSMSKRARASSTVSSGLRWKLLYSAAIRATSY
eukprot:1723341-Prorocentrum_lima.AAC.1